MNCSSFDASKSPDVNSHTLVDSITLTSPRHCLKGGRLRIGRNTFLKIEQIKGLQHIKPLIWGKKCPHCHTGFY